MTDNDEKKKAIASRLTTARKQAGLSQQSVAEMLSLHRPAISEIEAGRRRVAAEELASFAKIYGVSVSWLSCMNDDTVDPLRDRVELAARELRKLKDEDLKRVLEFLESVRGGE